MMCIHVAENEDREPGPQIYLLWSAFCRAHSDADQPLKLRLTVLKTLRRQFFILRLNISGNFKLLELSRGVETGTL
jgi:hypothetical protein